MTQTPWEAFIDRVPWEGAVPVECEPAKNELDALERLRLGRLNAGVLAALGMLNESGSESSETDGATTSLARVDAKLDILLEMFNRHLLGRIQLPERHLIRLNTRGALIRGYPLLAAGSCVLVRIYFDACAGMPLEVQGHVEGTPPNAWGITPRPVGAPQNPPTDRDTVCFVYFGRLPDTVRQGIEHLIFREQRRQLAEARGNTPPKD